MNYPENCQWFEVYHRLPAALNYSQALDDNGVTDGGILVKPAPNQRHFAYVDATYFKKYLAQSTVYLNYLNANYMMPYAMQFEHIDYEKVLTTHLSNKAGCYAAFYRYLGPKPVTENIKLPISDNKSVKTLKKPEAKESYV